MLVMRLKVVLSLLVDHNQGAFIQDQSIIHSILPTQDLIRHYRRKNISPRCILKVDMKKTYDSIEWKFIEQLMRAFGFPNTFIKWLMACLTTSSFSLMINGEITGFFAGGIGLRQGDPISLLVFVLVMEYLTCISKIEA
ncbi:hypothetical protein L6164_033384 [Bauhinia variegata]|uniref:Uncharacterized protein n=1 Tax=Bauhinia variegata TaxID=167791 RepID=A0ACB9KRP6_BAUVA|nr:hypothetical protein L6164_033384 [Bauhinia variegata]